MKVVFLDNTIDGKLIGGAHTFLHKIMGGLQQKNIEVHFVTKGLPSAKTARNIENSGAIFHNKIWPQTALVEDAAPLLAKWLIQLNPDVFVVSVSPDIGWVVLPLLPANIATIAIGHNDAPTFYEPARYYLNFLTMAIGVSDEICRKYVTESGINETRVKWIPYGVVSAPDQPAILEDLKSGPLKIIYAGRLEEGQKRSTDLVKIIKLLQQKKINFHFNIIGDGPSFHEIKEQLTAEIDAGLVQMPGWVDNEDLIVRLRQSEIFVLTSALEGFCISLVEAMANGCCPIVTDIASGNKQLVNDGQNGYVIPVGDTSSFADKIASLASDPSKLLAFRQKAWETGKLYSVERMVNQYYSFFMDAIVLANTKPRQVDPDFPLMESCRSKYPAWLRRIKAKVLNK